jgi:activator of HSP90 ATPase
MKIPVRTIRQTVVFRATPDEVFRALTDEHEHAAFTDGVVHMKTSVGSAFDAYDGYITGKILNRKEDAKIVWAWRADEEGWPEGHFSKVTIELKQGKNGTELRFIQTDVPSALAEQIAEGWKDYYWHPLKRMLER